MFLHPAMVLLEAFGFCQTAVQIISSIQIVTVFAERYQRRQKWHNFLFADDDNLELQTWDQLAAARMRHAAVQMQRLTRGFLGRKAAELLLREVSEKNFVRQDAARQLQPVIRGFLVRRHTSFTVGSYLSRNGYKPTRCLGQGGYGQVWLARGATGDFAIKRQSRAGAEHEHAMLQRARGPGVVQCMEHFVGGCWGFLVLAVGSTTLAHRLRAGRICKQCGPMILGQFFQALARIHAVQMIHRDIKPCNVIFRGHDLAIIDFGHASVSENGQFSGRFGTQGYAAPEIRSGKTYTVAADVYSAGVLSREVLIASHGSWAQVESPHRGLISRCAGFPARRPSAEEVAFLFCGWLGLEVCCGH